MFQDSYVDKLENFPTTFLLWVSTTSNIAPPSIVLLLWSLVRAYFIEWQRQVNRCHRKKTRKQKTRKLTVYQCLLKWQHNNILLGAGWGENFVSQPRKLAKWFNYIGNINLVEWTSVNLTQFSTMVILYQFQFNEAIVGIRLQSCQYAHKCTTLPGYTPFNPMQLWWD